MTIPAINGPHLLFQYIKQLALPPEIYPAVKKMSSILNFNFTFALASDSRIRRNATSHPEVQLMALVVFATKLGYPFDSDVVKRHPRSLGEPAALRYDWKKWMELRKQGSSLAERGSKLPLQNGQESNITDADVFQMSEGLALHIPRRGGLRQAAFARHVVGGGLGRGDDHRSIERQRLHKRKLRVARARRQIHEQDVQIAPFHVLDELLDGLHHHRAAPDDGRVVVDQKTHAHHLDAVPLHRDQAGVGTVVSVIKKR